MQKKQQKQDDDDITHKSAAYIQEHGGVNYSQALKIVESKYPNSSFEPAQSVVGTDTLKRFLSDDILNASYVLYGHDNSDGTDFQNLILVSKETGRIFELGPDGKIYK
ncbi:hypothetical protein [Clostridium coskatii]|uniref:Uncharacterized protein n=1 Tax=Clostridium coskatii TaxID=1705578 RepID=A0A166SKY4_9CLOT|nr:hypothetical protein [Clostridium coskatii]OAA92464.1 hypothetical protein WX73_00943 [Clostridium coskatii]OBR89947.1 hypothetical protein CLCOS_42560 [Clostridium coskatii]